MWENVIHKIVQWLKDELNETKTKGFVLGISGGLDSSVCAALIKKATDNCLGLILPIESDIKDIDDASEMASVINIKTQYIDLTSVYNSLIKFLPDNNQVALGNIKARLRMVVIYYYANLNNYLVCGTGNKTELSLGYFTKYGDGACDILPLGDLYKFEVREIAKTLGIPEQIIKKVPSADLWQGQTDEGEIGFSYDVIDKTLQEIEKNQIKGDVAEKLKSRIEHNEHKRKPPKICFFRHLGV
jgi:NAD+ synthase